MRFSLRGFILLWVGALMAWLTGADAALLARFDASRFSGRLQPLFEWYSEWGLLIFNVFLVAMLVHGLRHKPSLFKVAGLAYVYAQVFGTLLLVRVIKIGCGRPRPHVDPLHDALCQVPSLAHAYQAFPSSHAAHAAVAAMFVLLLLRSRTAVLLALTATLFMALARVAIGQHYLSDVLAGMGLGVAVVGVVMRAYLLPRWREIESAQAR